MLMNPIRKIIRKAGFDFHRYRHEQDKMFWIRSHNINTVLDIGANVGQFAHEIRGTLPHAQIISFEPIKECFDKLMSSFANDTHFQAFNIAIGAEAGSLSMNKSSYTPSSSLLPMADIHKQLFPHTKEHTVENVAIKRLDDLLRDMKLEDEILIKIDVQGYEGKVIEGGQEIFKRTRAAIIENSFSAFYDGQPLFNDIYAKMLALGFSYRGNLHQKKDVETGEILFEDSIFVRKG
jgi:FkbM family methyltransferase